MITFGRYINILKEERGNAKTFQVSDESTIKKLKEGSDYKKIKFDLSNLDDLFSDAPNPDYKLNYKTDLTDLDAPTNADTKAWIIEEDGVYYLFKLYTVDHSHFYIHYVYGGKQIDSLENIKKLITVKDGKYDTYSSGLLKLNSESEAKIQAILDHKTYSRVIVRKDGRIIVETSSQEFNNSKFKICVYLLAKANPSYDITITSLKGDKDKIVIDNQKSTDAFTNKESKNTLMNFLVGNETRGVKEPEKAFSAQASDDYSMSKAMLRRRNLHSLAESKK